MTTYKSGSLPISATFKSTDDTLTSHTWKVNGIPETATTSTFVKSFNAYGTYEITHEGTNSCGSSCTPVTETLVLSEAPQIPTEYLIIGTIGLISLGLIGIFLWQPQRR